MSPAEYMGTAAYELYTALDSSAEITFIVDQDGNCEPVAKRCAGTETCGTRTHFERLNMLASTGVQTHETALGMRFLDALVKSALCPGCGRIAG